MTLGTRLLLGCGATLLLMVVLAAVSITKVQAINADPASVNDVNSVKQRHAITSVAACMTVRS